MPRLPGPQEFLAVSLENDTAVELELVFGLHRLVQGILVDLADGEITTAEISLRLEQVRSLAARAERSLQYNRVHNAVLGALRAGLDPRTPAARARFPLLRELDPREATLLRFPGEPEEVVA